ncbi:tetratricopeptide repeat protein [Desulfosudis oleivorans]|nr:tetratricopeptide repeat protein [Desulfosudis oleivorans]
MVLLRVIIVFLLVTGLPPAGMAASQTFVETYAYNAGESDSKLTCRTVSLIEVKRLLLEKIGVYLESRTEVQNFQIAKDTVTAITAGIVKLEILDEQWNGEQYAMTARIVADPDEIARSIDAMRNTQGKMADIEKLRTINEESVEQMREMQARMEQLQSDLLSLNQDAGAHQGILDAWGLYEKAVQMRQTGRTKEAIEALNTVIAGNPTYLAYFERAMAYMEQDRYHEAIADFNQTLKVEPKMRGALFGRGMAYLKTGNREAGRRDIEKAAALGNGRAVKWLREHSGRNGL